MTPSRKTLVLPLAGLLLVGAAGAALAATSSSPRAGTGTIAPAADPSPSAGATSTPADPGTRPGRGFAHVDGVLEDVLDSLVDDGTITGDQKQAILDGVKAEREARVAEARERAQQARERAQQLRELLEDGVITKEEFDQLPEDSPVRDLAGAMDDGKITRDELRALRGFGGFGFGGRGDHRFGPRHGGWPGFPGWDKDGASPKPSASPTTGG